MKKPHYRQQPPGNCRVRLRCVLGKQQFVRESFECLHLSPHRRAADVAAPVAAFAELRPA